MSFYRLPKSNLHTHTDFGDGLDSAEEMVLAAIGCGMEVIGLSEHACTPFDLRYCLTPQTAVAYRQEIVRLRQKYGERIGILSGIEQDFYADPAGEPYDYSVGSVHYVFLDGCYCEIDGSPDALMQTVREHCGGDIYRLIRTYYRTVAQVIEKTGCTIIGHFDLITKFNEGNRFFDENDPRYRQAALEALDVLLERDGLFEINTGAVSRNYRRLPYPAAILLQRIAEKRGRVTVSSDAHRKEHLLYGFPMAVQIARAAGLGSLQMMTRSGWKNCPL